MVGEWGSAIPSYPTNSTAAGNFVSPFWMAGVRETGGVPCCRPGGSEWERMTPQIHHSHRRMSIACFGHPCILQLQVSFNYSSVIFTGRVPSNK